MNGGLSYRLKTGWISVSKPKAQKSLIG